MAYQQPAVQHVQQQTYAQPQVQQQVSYQQVSFLIVNLVRISKKLTESLILSLSSKSTNSQLNKLPTPNHR